MEDLEGLQFRVLSDDELIVKSNVDQCIELENSEKLMLYNFEQMERFCHKLGKRKKSEFEISVYRYYVVLKNFVDENLHVPGNEAKIYSISPYEYNFAFLFSIYGNGKYNKPSSYTKDEGFITIDIMHPFFNPTQNYKKVNCFISIIDIEGKERFTQSGELNLKLKDDVKSFPRFLSRETVLRNSFELLHSNDLIFCVNLERELCSSFALERELCILFEAERELRNLIELDLNNLKILTDPIHPESSNSSNSSINIDSYDNEIGLFEKYSYTRALLLNTDVGKFVCEKLPIIERMFYEIQSMGGSFIKKDLKNICRLLIGTGYIKHIDFKGIRTLYRMAHSFKIIPVQEFCSFLVERRSDSLQHVCPELTGYYSKLGKRNVSDYVRSSVKNVLTPEFPRRRRSSEHVHDVSAQYIECYCPDENEEEIVRRHSIERIIESDFGSFFDVDENGDVILVLDSNFGKLLYKKSVFLRRMIEHSWSETQSKTIRIQQKDIEVFKNIYRLLMGANYIKESSILDVISLYEVSDFYDIPDIINTCIDLFKRYNLDENIKLIRELAEMYRDVRLQEIVKTYKAENIIKQEYFHAFQEEILSPRSNEDQFFTELSKNPYDFYQ